MCGTVPFPVRDPARYSITEYRAYSFPEFPFDMLIIYHKGITRQDPSDLSLKPSLQAAENPRIGICRNPVT